MAISKTTHSKAQNGQVEKTPFFRESGFPNIHIVKPAAHLTEAEEMEAADESKPVEYHKIENGKYKEVSDARTKAQRKKEIIEYLRKEVDSNSVREHDDLVEISLRQLNEFAGNLTRKDFKIYLDANLQLTQRKREDIYGEAFFAGLRENFWTFIPEEYKLPLRKAQDLSGYSPNPKCKLLVKLLKDFVSYDSLRLSMMQVNIDSEGVVATDAIKLAYLPGKSKTHTGLYCITRQCLKAIGLGDKDASYPDWKAAIPKSKIVGKLEIEPLLKVVRTLEAIGYGRGNFQSDSHFIRLQIDDFFIPFDVKRMREVLEFWRGLKEDGISIGFTDPRQAMIMAPATTNLATNRALYEHPFVLLMPVADVHEASTVVFDVRKSLVGMGDGRFPFVPVDGGVEGVSTPKPGTKNQDNKQSLKTAIAALQIATEFAEDKDLNKIEESIMALEAAIEFI